MKSLIPVMVVSFLIMNLANIVIASDPGYERRKEAWRMIQQKPASTVRQEKEIREQQALEYLYEVRRELAITVKNKRKAGMKIPWVRMHECKIWLEPSNVDSWDGKGVLHHGQVLVRFSFVNLTDWELVGLHFRVDYVDRFGDILYSAEYKDQIRIQPWSVETTDGRWIYEDNPYIKEEPYDKLWPAVNAKTLIAKITIEKIAWANGNITVNYSIQEKAKPKKEPPSVPGGGPVTVSPGMLNVRRTYTHAIV